ncbi:MAG TPA: hypothetical protein GXZ59_03455 [Clostridiaceae bacterium]|jgi:hypothetical protein|nr:hypothetical protein [Clostridiaceae bacterium]
MKEAKLLVGPISSKDICVDTLEEKLNAWLEVLDETNARILDVKFSSNANDSSVCGAVLVLYEREKYEGES